MHPPNFFDVAKRTHHNMNDEEISTSYDAESVAGVKHENSVLSNELIGSRISTVKDLESCRFER